MTAEEAFLKHVLDYKPTEKQWQEFNRDTQIPKRKGKKIGKAYTIEEFLRIINK